jgi:predicted RNase H-like HicB family nuclease
MITYRAAYTFTDQGVHAEVLDFPGAISCGADLDVARRMLQGALVEMAETALREGEPLPIPDPQATSSTADLEEPIHLLLTAATRVQVVPVAAVGSTTE